MVQDRLGCIISNWVFKIYMDAVMKEVKMGMGKNNVVLLSGEEGLECKVCVDWIHVERVCLEI